MLDKLLTTCAVITPPIILANAANLSQDQQRYLVSTSLIVCGILSSIQITRFHSKLPQTPNQPPQLTTHQSGEPPTTSAQASSL